MVRAYVLIESPFETSQEVDSRIGSLGNCKALGHRIVGSELVVHIECTEVADLNTALTQDFASLPGVTRVTPLVIMPDGNVP